MNELKISFRYAKGLLLSAMETNQFDAVLSDVERVERAVKNIPEFLSDLDKEDVPLDKRIALTKDLCKSIDIDVLVTELLCLLVERNRITLFPYIAITYRDLVDDIQKNKRVLIKVSDKKQKKQAMDYVEKLLEEHLGCKVFCECEVDTKIIGGVVLQIGDVVCDMSVTNRINEIVEEIKRGLYGYKA